MSDTIYTLKITDHQSPHYGQVGRWKDKDTDGLTLIRFPGGESEWFMQDEFVDTDGTIYTKPAKGKKWHIRHTQVWTLCYQPCSAWEITDNAPELGEVCQQCQAIAEAIRAGDADDIPF